MNDPRIARAVHQGADVLLRPTMVGILRCGKMLPPQLNLVIEIEFADATTALWSENAGAHPAGAAKLHQTWTTCQRFALRTLCLKGLSGALGPLGKVFDADTRAVLKRCILVEVTAQCSVRKKRKFGSDKAISMAESLRALYSGQPTERVQIVASAPLWHPCLHFKRANLCRAKKKQKKKKTRGPKKRGPRKKGKRGLLEMQPGAKLQRISRGLYFAASRLHAAF